MSRVQVMAICMMALILVWIGIELTCSGGRRQ